MLLNALTNINLFKKLETYHFMRCVSRFSRQLLSPLRWRTVWQIEHRYHSLIKCVRSREKYAVCIQIKTVRIANYKVTLMKILIKLSNLRVKWSIVYNCAPRMLPAASVFIAAGRVLRLWGGAVSTVLQHIIGQVCEQFLQLEREKKNRHMKMSHWGYLATKQ